MGLSQSRLDLSICLITMLSRLSGIVGADILHLYEAIGQTDELSDSPFRFRRPAVRSGPTSSTASSAAALRRRLVNENPYRAGGGRRTWGDSLKFAKADRRAACRLRPAADGARGPG
ncbi:hypothetical protein EVAR_62688_1 [Eumeta japonica]|uniref:Uncharacterized protein n=1 Tax=Eumeta variegata TaxID=151549 RepID=A0A4C1ZYW7_EUMVA|nr:hypothetical protein EVAR_62688_1 [Eumeta japonica]